MPKTKLSLYTVPHTGAHFTIELLKRLGIEHASGTGFFHIHSPQVIIDDWSAGGWYTISNTNCIVTARDPILTGIRYIYNNQPVSQVTNNWISFLESLDHLSNYFVLDVGCREEDRLQHLRDLAVFVGKNPNTPIIEEYAAGWKPLNKSNNEMKQRYLETGELPKTQIYRAPQPGIQYPREDQYVDNVLEIDWSALDDAVAWYKSLPTNDA